MNALVRPREYSIYLKEFRRRVESRKGTEESNCIGTAAFLALLREKDSNISEPAPILRMLRPIPEPIEGAVVSWNYLDQPIHMAVITSADPLRMAHRNGARGQFVYDVEVPEISELYLRHRSDIVKVQGVRAYYLPETAFL
jgi:hypothetical protein